MSLRSANLSEDAAVAVCLGLRRSVLAAHGARDRELDELLFYNRNRFDFSQASHLRFPLPDEACVATWESYAALVSRAGSLRAIYPYLAPLQFPIRSGVSTFPEYRAAVRLGASMYPGGIATGLELEAPDRCRVLLHSTEAGRLPVIIPASRRDFAALICAFTRKHEPASIPDSMGAIIIGGFHNFHRIHTLRAAYLAAGNAESTWMEEFAQIKQQKHLYQDRFVILSPGPYSGVPASDLQIKEPAWELLSLTIRLEHESTHYLTRRVFGSMQNNLMDELIADYCGLIKAAGTYSAAWALRFLGINPEGVYRAGGRLQNYLGDPPLSSGAFAVLVRLARSAACNLERLYQATSALSCNRLIAVLTLASFSLEELATLGGEQDLIMRLQACAEWFAPAAGLV